MGKRKPTVGEKIASDCDFTWGYTIDAEERIQKRLARRIDRAVRQAFKDGVMCGPFASSDDAALTFTYHKYAAKYGVKP